MIPSRVFAILVLLAALPLNAQVSTNPVRTDPPDPTSADSVTLLVEQVGSCPPSPTLTRTGFDINVTLHGGVCLYPPFLITWKLELGTLAPGTYTVNVAFPGQPSSYTATFVVLDANASVIVSQS